MLKIGCCGFPKARDVICRRLPVVEVQRTFYQLPRPATVAGWRAWAPEGFEFTLKAWQVITHPAGSPTYRRLREPLERPNDAGFFRPTEIIHAAWRRTRDAAKALGARIVLFQCPARFTPTDEHIADMRAFFLAAERDDLVFAWEPRGDWSDALVRELCRELGLVHAVDPFLRSPVHGTFAYFRLHGIGGSAYRYTDDDLQRLLALCAKHETAYCLFNNQTMFEDALRLQASSRF